MKRALLLLFLLSTLMTYSQELPSIAGVRLGTDYKTCKEKFDNRFNNGQTSEQESPNLLKYFLVNFAGSFFDRAIFGFQTDVEGNTFLTSADFMVYYSLEEKNEAKKKRDELFQVYKRKYDFRWSDIDKDGWKYYVLGYDPINPANGLIAIHMIQMTKWMYVNIGYGPINLINPQDEI